MKTIKRLLNNDVLLKHRNTNDFSGTPIRLIDNEQKSDLMFFEVCDVSLNVKEIETGQIVLVSWSRVTPPFLLDDEQRYVVTDEKEIAAIYGG